MIVIVEGIDRVGKTTLCKKLENQGFTYLKDEWLFKPEEGIAAYSFGKLDTTIKMLKTMNDSGVNVVMDRCHLTELVYGTINRGGDTLKNDILKLDLHLGFDSSFMLVLVEPTDINRSSLEAEADMSNHNEKFKKLFMMSGIKNKLLCNYHTIEEAVAEILNKTFKYDFYFASPFFRESQVEREEALKTRLRKLGFKIYSPKEECFLPATSTHEDREKVFSDNCKAIQSAKAVFAITDEKDMGTIWEAGYAYGIKKPVIYFAETLGNNQFNLMLAQSGKHVFLDRDSITYGALVDALLSTGKNRFEGLIE